MGVLDAAVMGAGVKGRNSFGGMLGNAPVEATGEGVGDRATAAFREVGPARISPARALSEAVGEHWAREAGLPVGSPLL